MLWTKTASTCSSAIMLPLLQKWLHQLQACDASYTAAAENIDSLFVCLLFAPLSAGQPGAGNRGNCSNDCADRAYWCCCWHSHGHTHQVSPMHTVTGATTADLPTTCAPAHSRPCMVPFQTHQRCFSIFSLFCTWHGSGTQARAVLHAVTPWFHSMLLHRGFAAGTCSSGSRGVTCRPT